jgi:small-conductance mechanosensitive channel
MPMAPWDGNGHALLRPCSRALRSLVLLGALVVGACLSMACFAEPRDTPAGASSSPASASSSGPSALDPGESGAPVQVWNRTIVVLHAPLRGRNAQERARATSERIEAAIDTLKPEDLKAEWMQSGDDAGMAIRGNNLLLLAILPADTPEGNRAGAEKEGQQALNALRDILRERAESNRPMELLRDVALTLAATLLLVLAGWLVSLANRGLQRRLARITDERLKLDIAGFDLRPIIWTLLRRLIELIKLAFMLFLVYVWLSSVLSLFPYSSPWGRQLGTYLYNLCGRVAMAFVGQIPNLITLVVIFIIARGMVRLINAWFQAIEAGTVRVAWLEGPAAGVTRRLASIAIWLFALIVAYPYIPGAGTDAFKGVSVFVGLMLSLGSAGVVNQAVSGLVVLYSGAIRNGDFIEIGEHQGVVREMGALSMKILTRTREEVTVPNSVLSSTSVRNLTRQSREAGFLLTTSVTIGYDTPWRQVVAMLELAASRTDGLLPRPRPFVLQTALSDFYIEYQLNVALLNPPDKFEVLSQLHQKIQDAFNEFGVQIMSPHFFDQPAEKVWVPREHWHDSPAVVPTATQDRPPKETSP